MRSTVIAVSDIPRLDHDQAMVLAATEYQRLLDAVERLRPEDWSAPTECAGWDVKAMLSHLLGMMQRVSDRDEAAHQDRAAAERAQATGEAPIDALTALQVEERAHLGPDELTAALQAAVPGAVAGRSGTTPELREMPFDPGPPFTPRPWTLGYLLDVILTRDPWMHRVDLARATGGDLVLTADHDGRIVADVVADWARLHARPFTLVLDGPAGGTYVSGEDGEDGERHELDAVEFCRTLSGRAPGRGLLAHQIPF